MRKIIFVIIITLTAATSTAQKLTDQNKIDWNNFLNHLEAKKLRGLPCLDQNNMGNALFIEYINTHKTSLSIELIPLIRAEYLEIRNRLIKDIESGKVLCTHPGRFMLHVVNNEKTTNPNYVGQNLTKSYFPYVITDKALQNKPLSNFDHNVKFITSK
jgi:hypothetical protein